MVFVPEPPPYRILADDLLLFALAVLILDVVDISGAVLDALKSAVHF